MDYKTAFEILEIPIDIDINKLNLNYLKKKYHKLALLNHPDKNGNTIESNEKFKKINEAYDYLKREIKYSTDEDINENYDILQSSDIKILLKLFINSFLEGKYTEIITNLIADIISGCKKISLKLFEDLDKDKLLNVYTFLSKYRTILKLNEDILDDIKKIVANKYKNVSIYKLNPSINDLINNNIYKLYINNELYLVPLWINESYFENNGNEIFVICEPELPKNIRLDEDNNIFIDSIYYSLTDLNNKILNDESIIFNVGDKEIKIPLSKLYIKREQYYTIKNEGILRQDLLEADNYNTIKTDITVKIVMTE